MWTFNTICRKGQQKFGADHQVSAAGYLNSLDLWKILSNMWLGCRQMFFSESQQDLGEKEKGSGPLPVMEISDKMTLPGLDL